MPPADPAFVPLMAALDVRGLACLVVGAGKVGARKAASLAHSGAEVDIVATQVGQEARAVKGARCLERPYAEGDVATYRLVVAATGDVLVDRQVVAEALAAGVFVLDASGAGQVARGGTFTMPAVLQRDRLLVSVSTSASAPRYATWLRDSLAEQVRPEHGLAAAILGEVREEMLASGRRPKELNWRRIRMSDMLDMLREGQVGPAKELVRRCLSW